jgi:hypothetical protein
VSRGDARSLGLLGPALERFGVAVLMAVVGLGACAALVIPLVYEPAYSATRTYIVGTLPAVHGVDPELVTANIERAARDYASVLTSDDILLGAIAGDVGRTEAHVRDNVEALYLPASSSILVRYTGASQLEVFRFFAALNQQIKVSGVLTARLPAGVVRPLVPVGSPSRVSNPVLDHPWLVIPLLLPVCLGIAVLVERARPRVLSPGQLRALSGLPVVELSDPPDAVDRALEVLLGQDFRVQAVSPLDGEDAARLGSAREDGGGVLVLVRQHGSLRDVERALADLPYETPVVLGMVGT